MSRHLVTGATGFVGGEVARQRRAAGHDVVTLADGLRITLEHEMRLLGISLPRGQGAATTWKARSSASS